ncbi:uncharacterized protein LOC129228374 [Uloborus diversus]|uniref:uncharacterized protein LOC129228374 n=1 Tax=Uloborus diversus TaxID=327109 RepID=UPI002409AED7|nr:uncharacterized protein LOC129228374 [Uloborus diversus]
MAAQLRAAANHFQFRRNQPILAIERGILQNEDLNHEERAAVDAMHTAQDDASVFTIAGFINRCLTSKTLKAALRYLSYSASSKNQELAIACELASILLPKICAVPSCHALLNVIEEFIEDRLGANWYMSIQV